MVNFKEINEICSKYTFAAQSFRNNLSELLCGLIDELERFITDYDSVSDPMNLFNGDSLKSPYNTPLTFQKGDSGAQSLSYKYVHLVKDINDIIDSDISTYRKIKFNKPENMVRYILTAGKTRLDNVLTGFYFADPSIDREDNLTKFIDLYCDMLDDIIEQLENIGKDENESKPHQYLTRMHLHFSFAMLMQSFSVHFATYLNAQRLNGTDKYQYRFLNDVLFETDVLKHIKALCDRLNKIETYRADFINANADYAQIEPLFISYDYSRKDIDPKCHLFTYIFDRNEDMKNALKSIYSYAEYNFAKDEVVKFNSLIDENGLSSELDIDKLSVKTSIFNINNTEEDYKNMALQYQKADDMVPLVGKCIELLDKNALDIPGLAKLVKYVIVENKKIRDMTFKTEKTSVINDFLINLIFKDRIDYLDANGQSVTAYNGFTHFTDEKIKLLIDTFYDQICNPYFVTLYALRDSTIREKSITSAQNFNRLARVAFSDNKFVKDFITRYEEELNKPESERVSTVKRFNKEFITYSSLKYIIMNYINNESRKIDVISKEQTNPKILLMGIFQNGDVVDKLTDYVEATILDRFKVDFSTGTVEALKGNQYGWYSTPDDRHRDIFSSFYLNFREAFITSPGENMYYRIPNELNITEYYTHSELDRLIKFIEGTDEENNDYEIKYNPILLRNWNTQKTLSNTSKIKVGNMSSYILAMAIITSLKFNPTIKKILTDEQIAIIDKYLRDKIDNYTLEYLPTVCDDNVLKDKCVLSGDPYYDENLLPNLIQFSDVARLHKIIQFKNMFNINTKISIPENCGFVPFYSGRWFDFDKNISNVPEENNYVSDLISTKNSELLSVLKPAFTIFANDVDYEIFTKQAVVRYISASIMCKQWNGRENINEEMITHINHFKSGLKFDRLGYAKENLDGVYEIIAKNYSEILKTFSEAKLITDEESEVICQRIKDIQTDAQCLNIIE